MIRALIVDDEKITRKGMIAVIPWERFGIRIVGDVGSGSAALAFLEDHPVDLAFVDVAMPGMNGIELIREMRVRRLRCAVVVLTFYDDFAYVQEALRLGAVDYVLKTQLDDEKVLEMLDRVARRVREAGPVTDDRWLLVRPLDRGPSALALVEPPDDPAKSAAAAADAGAALVTVTGASGIEPRDLLARLEGRLARHVFYEGAAETGPVLVDLGTLAREPAECPPEDRAALRQDWASITWILDDDAYAALLERTREVRPDAPDLADLFRSIRAGAAGLFTFLAEAPGGEAAGPDALSWTRWREGLQGIRDVVKQRVRQQRHSVEVARKVIEALEITRRTVGRNVKEEVVAARVALSRTYFSQCFQDLTGHAFKRYLIDKSIAEAKSLLRETDLPFRGISARLGYQNEGYLSRMFRTSTGLSPREFRAQSRSPEELS